MAANPALVAGPDRTLVPAPFQGEHIALGRQGVELALDNVQTRSGKCVSGAAAGQFLDTACSPLGQMLMSCTRVTILDCGCLHTQQDNTASSASASRWPRSEHTCWLIWCRAMFAFAYARWSPKGSLWLTNLRMVFVADQSDSGSGLRAFDIPLVYITADRFNQPIFVCNNLTGVGCVAELQVD